MKLSRIILFGYIGFTSTVGTAVVFMLMQPIVSALIPGPSADRPGQLDPPADVQLANQARSEAPPKLEPAPAPVEQTVAEPEPEPEPVLEKIPVEKPKQVAMAKPQATPAAKPKPAVKAAVALPPPPPPPPMPLTPPPPVQ